MGPKQAIRTGLSKFIVLKGRASRSEFWWLGLFVFICFIAILALLFWAFPIAVADPVSDWLIFAVILATFSITIRRLHDRSLSHRLALFLVATPIIMSIGSLVLFGPDATHRIDAVIRNSLNGVIDNQSNQTQFGFIVAYGAIMLVQLVLSLITFILCLLPSKPGSNPHGPNPHEVPS